MEQNKAKGVGNVGGGATIFTREVNRESCVETVLSQQTQKR